MKKNRIFAVIAAVVLVTMGAITFQACSRTKLQEIVVKHLDENRDADIIDYILLSEDPGIPFPEGSKAYDKGNGEYVLTLPSGYYWVVQSVEDRSLVYEAPNISIKCVCSDGDKDKCFPVEVNGSFYCAIDSGCKSCDRETTVTNQDRAEDKVQVQGLLNRNVGITFITDQPFVDDGFLFSLPISNMDVVHGNAFDALFQIDDVVEYLKSLTDYAENNGVELNTYTFASVFGNLLLVPLPEDPIISIDDEPINLKSIPSGSSVDKIKCDCTSGNGECKLKGKTVLGISVHYCEAQGCTSCVMSSLEQ